MAFPLVLVRQRWICLWLILLTAGISVVGGLLVGKTFRGGTVDFQVVYFGTRCLIQHHDPYKLTDLQGSYQEAQEISPLVPVVPHNLVCPFDYLPTSLSSSLLSRCCRGKLREHFG